MQIGGATPNVAPEDSVVASIAIFGREVNGIPVVGSGSKIAVWFANDREPVAFDVDWPRYKFAQIIQRVLTWDKLKSRVDLSAAMPPASDGAISRFECGYVDLGVEKRTNYIQSGCSIAYGGASGPPNPAGERTVWARIEFVPGGETVLA